MATYTTNYSLKKPAQSDHYDVDDFNDNADIIDAAIAGHAGQSLVHGATALNLANRLILRDANGRAKVSAPSAAEDIARKDTVDALLGINNKSTQEVKTLPIDTDTRSVVITRSSGRVSSVAVKDPTDNSTVESVTINRAGGLISSLVKSVGNRTIVYTVNRTDGLITNITKAVS